MYLVVPALRLEKAVVVSWLSSLLGLSVDDKKTSAEGFDVVDQEVDHVFIWMQSALSRQCIWSCQCSECKSSVGYVVMLLGLWGGRDKKNPSEEGFDFI